MLFYQMPVDFFFFSRMGGIWFKYFSTPRMVASGWAISKIFLSNTYVISRNDPWISTFGHHNGKDTESEQKSPHHHLLQLPTKIPPNSQSSITILLSSTLPLQLVSREGIREFTPWDFLVEFFQYHSTKTIKGESVREAKQTC